MSTLTNDELAAQITADLNEAEQRMADAGVPERTIRRFKAGHAIIADAATDLAGDGHITPDSVGGDK